jgi:hypothetical protein
LGLADVVASVIAIADSVTSDLQDDTVLHSAWIGGDAFGTSVYADPVPRRALVDVTTMASFQPAGELEKVKAIITFLELVPDTEANTDQLRQNPFDPRDILILPDGTTGPIIKIGGGLVNPLTHRPYMNEITLGK